MTIVEYSGPSGQLSFNFFFLKTPPKDSLIKTTKQEFVSCSQVMVTGVFEIQRKRFMRIFSLGSRCD